VEPQDEVGLLDLDAVPAEPQHNTLIYCCGPEPLLAAVESKASVWPSGALHVERFNAKPTTEPVRTESLDVVLDASGIRVTVLPEHSILAALEASGVGVLSSCTEGYCGTCETRVLGGEPDHRDSILTDEERQANNSMMICVSRSLTHELISDL
jgi:ferredoxin